MVFFFILCFVFTQELQELGLQGCQQAACVCWGLGRGIKSSPLSSQGCSRGSKHAGTAKGGGCGVFLGCTTVYQDTDPICVSGENIPEQLGPEERREGNTDIPGLTQHGGGCPAEGQLATAAGFAHILPKNKHLQPRGPQGCLWVLERRRNLRCEFVWGCSGSRSKRSKAHAQGTGGAVQINTEGFAFCSFMANVGMGTCQAGLLDRLLTDRSKRSSRGKCRCGKFRKSLQSSRCPPKCTPGLRQQWHLLCQVWLHTFSR